MRGQDGLRGGRTGCARPARSPLSAGRRAHGSARAEEKAACRHRSGESRRRCPDFKRSDVQVVRDAVRRDDEGSVRQEDVAALATRVPPNGHQTPRGKNRAARRTQDGGRRTEDSAAAAGLSAPLPQQRADPAGGSPRDTELSSSINKLDVTDICGLLQPTTRRIHILPSPRRHAARQSTSRALKHTWTNLEEQKPHSVCYQTKWTQARNP